MGEIRILLGQPSAEIDQGTSMTPVPGQTLYSTEAMLQSCYSYRSTPEGTCLAHRARSIDQCKGSDARLVVEPKG